MEYANVKKFQIIQQYKGKLNKIFKIFIKFNRPVLMHISIYLNLQWITF